MATSLQLGFHKAYAALALALLMAEVCIAWFIHDGFIRPFIGDMLVVILIFAGCRSFVAATHWHLALGVLLFAFAIEIGQYFQLATVLGLQHNRLARTIIGTTFDFRDLLAYSLGIALVLCIDAVATRRSRRRFEHAATLPPDGPSEGHS